jgi:hypothetical protein
MLSCQVPGELAIVTPERLRHVISAYEKAGLVYNDTGFVDAGLAAGSEFSASWVRLAGKVVADGVVTLSEPKATAPAVAGIDVAKDKNVVIIRRDGEWLEVRSGGKTGWVPASAVKCIQSFHPKFIGMDRKELGLGCSSFATAVLAQVRGVTLSATLHVEYGDKIAAAHGLAVAAKVGDVPALATAETVEALKLSDGVYFFDFRRGKGGHVGFVIVEKLKVVEQYHFTCQSPSDGLCVPSEFWNWLKSSKYNHKDASATFYKVTMPEPPKPAAAPRRTKGA